jgi:hypothetical protein
MRPRGLARQDGLPQDPGERRSSMRRRQLVELEDLPWFPAVLRDGGTAFLDFAERASGNGRKMVAPLERLLDATGQTQLIDLCSGGGGPAVDRRWPWPTSSPSADAPCSSS